MGYRTRCARCGRPATVVSRTCACGGQVTFDYPLQALRSWRPDGGGLTRYLPLLPVDGLPAAMGEGGTPLVESRSVGPTLGIRLFFKLESLNPTGSYKDRIATIGAALALAHQRLALIATSSGNAGAAIAAYAARAGLGAVIVVPEQAPAAKVTQIRAYGAVVVAVRGALSGAGAVGRMFEAVARAAEERGWLPMITAYRFAPAAMEGVKTLAHEVVESLGAAPDRVYIPVGGGGLLSATWRGFVETRALGWADRTPEIVAVQPEGCAPVVRAAQGQAPVAGGLTTAISGLQVALPPDGDRALEALRASKGSAVAVPDAAVYAAQQRLAREEAVFAEPAGAAALAGLLVDAAAGKTRRGEVIVCLVTGTGFKDPERLEDDRAPAVLDVGDLDRLAEVAADGLAAIGRRHRSSTVQRSSSL